MHFPYGKFSNVLESFEKKTKIQVKLTSGILVDCLEKKRKKMLVFFHRIGQKLTKKKKLFWIVFSQLNSIVSIDCFHNILNYQLIR